jgi:hypothetical protein
VDWAWRERKNISPRRPDLILCRFFLWGWAGEAVSRSNPRKLVSRSNPRTLDELERKIRDTLPVFLVTFKEKGCVRKFQIADV